MGRGRNVNIKVRGTEFMYQGALIYAGIKIQGYQPPEHAL